MKKRRLQICTRDQDDGQHPVNAKDIVVTPTLENCCIFIEEYTCVVILAREWGIRLLCNAE